MVFTPICALNVEKGIKFDMKKNILLVLICIGIIFFFSGVFLLINENKNTEVIDELLLKYIDILEK